MFAQVAPDVQGTGIVSWGISFSAAPQTRTYIDVKFINHLIKTYYNSSLIINGERKLNT